jgi:hypothetical protein
MKEFALKHPIITFLLADSFIAGAYKTICFVATLFGKNQPDSEALKEENADEPANDIQ